jgi:UDP:flavonoid glycosyltransferase YjiC (YdhE family)
MPLEVNADSIRKSVLDLLQNTNYRRAARHIQSEIAAMPAPDETVPVIERIGGARGRSLGQAAERAAVKS